jgi:TPR repeat protein
MATLWQTKAAIRWYLFCFTVVLFLLGLVVFAFSGCDVRQRSAKKACRGGSSAQCLVVGKYYEARMDGLFGFLMSNYATAVEYYGKACKIDSAEGYDGCERLGYLILHPADSARDHGYTTDGAYQALRRACANKVTKACDELADATSGSGASP